MASHLIAPKWLLDGYALPVDLKVTYCDDLTTLSDEEIGSGEFIVIPYLQEADDIAKSVPRMKTVRVIQTLTAGFEKVLPLVSPGVTLCNAANVHDDSTSEMALTLTLAALREIPRSIELAQNKKWGHFFSKSLADKKVLLIGYGGVGKATEARLLAFNCEVIPVATKARDHVKSIIQLPELIPDADLVVLTVPLNESTRGLVDARFLELMKPGSLLVNVARGPVVDTKALLNALESGKISAALDVTDPEPLPENHPLWSAPNCLITPHLGGETDVFEPRARDRIHRQLDLWLSGQPLECVITN